MDIKTQDFTPYPETEPRIPPDPAPFLVGNIIPLDTDKISIGDMLFEVCPR